MKSKFNAVFETYVTEATLPPVGSSLTTMTSADASTSNISALSGNTPNNTMLSGVANAANKLGQSISNAASVAMNVAPEILKNLKAQEKFWGGQAGNGVDLLIQTLEDYNTKKRLNALYGVVDYMKCRKPTIHAIPPCEFLSTIENKLNETK